MKFAISAVCFAIALCLAQGSVLARPLPVTRERAEATARHLVAGGTVVFGNLERERGMPVWWIDVSIPGSRNVQTIRVDANTGQVISNTVESPEDR
jgi:uncharacterized membrane protein YkoI